jgi:transposase
MSKPNDVVRQIKKATRRKFSADEKIRIVLEGLRGEISISELSRKEGIAASVYYLTPNEVFYERKKLIG